MPEGDTIHRLAARLRPGLLHTEITALRLRTHGDVRVVVGRRIEQVEALGKNLLLGIATGWVIRIHLGLRGRTRPLPPDADPARLPAIWPLVLLAERAGFACTRAARAELRRRDDLRMEASLRRVGPDLLDPSTELHEVVTRARAPQHATRSIAEVLADQGIASGIGNVYKSEVLFLGRLHPETPVQAIDDAQLLALYTCARDLMRSNLGPGPRVTVGELRGARRRPEVSTVWVYRRAELPCLRCRTRIAMMRQGDMARSTYWCPRCQRAAAVTSSTTA